MATAAGSSGVAVGRTPATCFPIRQSCISTVLLIHDREKARLGPVSLSGTFQGLSSSLRLMLPGLTQVRVEPAAEAVLLVPAALPMADQDQLVRSHPRTDALCAVFPVNMA